MQIDEVHPRAVDGTQRVATLILVAQDTPVLFVTHSTESDDKQHVSKRCDALPFVSLRLCAFARGYSFICQEGARFCRKECSPSCPSSLVRRRAMVAAV